MVDFIMGTRHKTNAKTRFPTLCNFCLEHGCLRVALFHTIHPQAFFSLPLTARFSFIFSRAVFRTAPQLTEGLEEPICLQKSAEAYGRQVPHTLNRQSYFTRYSVHIFLIIIDYKVAIAKKRTSSWL